jgi:hypothetical protein
MRQRFFMVEHCTEIAHIVPTTARFAFPEMLCLGQWRPAISLTHNRPGMVRVIRATLVISYRRPL